MDSVQMRRADCVSCLNSEQNLVSGTTSSAKITAAGNTPLSRSWLCSATLSNWTWTGIQEEACSSSASTKGVASRLLCTEERPGASPCEDDTSLWREALTRRRRTRATKAVTTGEGRKRREARIWIAEGEERSVITGESGSSGTEEAEVVCERRWNTISSRMRA